MPKALYGKGWLQDAVLEAVEAHEKGKWSLEKGKLTPHHVALAVETLRDLPEDVTISSGAVAEVFKRWQEFDFALFHDKPFAFKRFTAKGEKEGYEALRAKVMEKRKEERRALRGTKVPAKKAAKGEPQKAGKKVVKKAPAKKAPAKKAGKKAPTKKAPAKKAGKKAPAKATS